MWLKIHQRPAAYSPCDVQQEVSVQRVCVVGGVDPSAPVAHTSEGRHDVGGQLDLWLEEVAQQQVRWKTKVVQT